MVFAKVFNLRAHIRRMDEVRLTLAKTGASTGANATIVCGHTTGRYAFVGAGEVVTRDVPDYAMVVGNSAGQLGWMGACGVTTYLHCPACGQGYNKVIGGQEPLENQERKATV